MEKMNEEKIEQTLQTLAQIQPSTESLERMQEKVRNQITERCQTDPQPLSQINWRLVSALAASILIAIGLLFTFVRNRPSPPPVHRVSQGYSKTSPTCLGSLNIAFEKEGMEGIEKLFKEFMKLKKPKPEIKSIDDAMNGQSEKEK